MTSTAIQLVFLGTSSAQPSPTRNHSSLALNLNSDTWLFDCGEATQHQILKTDNVKMTRIRRIFITHLHGDHCLGLPGLLCTLAGMHKEDMVIDVVGPANTRSYLRSALKFTESFLGCVKYRVTELGLKDSFSGKFYIY
jgi:ribonuclease Z